MNNSAFYFLIFLLIIMSIFAFNTPSLSERTEQQFLNSPRFQLVEKVDTLVYIIEDKQTHIKYWATINHGNIIPTCRYEQ